MAETIKKVVEIEIDVDSGDIKQVGKDVEGVGKDLKKAEKGTSGLAGGFKKVGTAIKAAGIGLLIAALGTLVEVFRSNQGAIDAFETGLTALKIAANDLFKFLEGNVGAVVDYFKSIFEDPKQALKDFADAFKKNIQERFDSYLDTLGFLASAVKKVFSGDFAGAMDDVKAAGKESLDVLTGVNNSFDKATEVVTEAVTAISDYTSETLKSAKASVELSKAAELAAIQQQGLIEEFDRAAELQRQIRDDETKSFEERIAANEKLGEILKEQIEAETALIDIQQKAIEDRLSKGLIPEFEAKKQLLELDNERAAILAKVTGFESEQLTNRNSLLREQAEFKQDLLDAELDRIKAIEEAEEAARKKQKEAEEAAAKEAIELQRQKQEAITSIARDGLNAAVSISDALAANQLISAKRAFQVQKAVSIAQTAIDTAQSAQSSYKAMSGIPIVGPVLGGIAAAAAVAMGVAQIATIASQKFEPKGGGGGSKPSVSQPSMPSSGGAAGGGAPQFNTVGTSGFNQVAGSIAQQNQEPVKAYVVSTDVTSQQSLDRNSREKSSF